MAERATIARPYAKAAFEYARDAKASAEAFADWSQGLALATQVVADPRIAELIKNPELTAADHASLVNNVGGERLNPGIKNFVRVLAENDRLLLLPEIAAHFECPAVPGREYRRRRSRVGGAARCRAIREAQAGARVND